MSKTAVKTKAAGDDLYAKRDALLEALKEVESELPDEARDLVARADALIKGRHNKADELRSAIATIDNEFHVRAKEAREKATYEHDQQCRALARKVLEREQTMVDNLNAFEANLKAALKCLKVAVEDLNAGRKDMADLGQLTRVERNVVGGLDEMSFVSRAAQRVAGELATVRYSGGSFLGAVSRGVGPDVMRRADWGDEEQMKLATVMNFAREVANG